MQQASQIDESAIRTLLDKYTAAIEAKDADATVACYSSDAVAFDLAPPLVMGPDVVRDPRDIQTWFDTWATPIDQNRETSSCESAAISLTPSACST